MTIRRWKYIDIKNLAEFEKKEFIDYWTFNQLADSFLNERFYGFLAEEDGKIIGCSAFNLGVEDADLVNILVASDSRKRGIGGKLMEEMLKVCREMELKSLFLEVRMSNYPAIKLYKKKLFKEVGKREKYYKDGETALIMKKEF